MSSLPTTVQRIDTDILIIGSGGSGLRAAIAASEYGLPVADCTAPSRSASGTWLLPRRLTIRISVCGPSVIAMLTVTARSTSRGC